MKEIRLWSELQKELQSKHQGLFIRTVMVGSTTINTNMPGKGSGCSTMVEHTPWEQKLERSWVRILPGAGLFSSAFLSFLTT